MFMGDESDTGGYPGTRILPSSIDCLPVTRGITKVGASPNSCILSGPNGNLRLWWFEKTRRTFNAKNFTSFSPISVLQIRELWVKWGRRPYPGVRSFLREQTPTAIYGAFWVLTKVEDLTLVSCQTEPFLAALGMPVDGCDVLLPRLRRLTVFVGYGDLDVPALRQCAKARKERSRPLGGVTVVFEKGQGTGLAEGLESLREFVEELVYCAGETPKFFWLDEE